MIGIKSSLLHPFIVILLLIVAVNLIAFDYIIGDYINKGIREQLVYTATGSKVLIKKEISEVVFDEDETKITSVLTQLNKILRSAKTNLNVELMLFSESGEMIYPVDYGGSFLNEGLIAAIRDRLAGLDETKAVTVEAPGRRAAVTGYRLTDLPITHIPYVVFASSLDVSDKLIQTVTAAMTLVFAIGGIISILLSISVANRMSRPVRELSDAARQIGERRKFTLRHKSGIREIVQLTDSISDMSSRIDSYDNAQKAFLQNASHELRTPLMSIQGYAEGIEKGMFADPRKAGAVIVEESRKLNKLLSELLMLSRIENMNYEVGFEPVVLNDIIREYAHTIEGLALKEGKRAEFAVCGETLTILYNETLFSQCLMNVAGNAFRYCAGQVMVSVFRDGGSAVITVEDDGSGIDPKDLPHLFERFYKGPGGQTGLGLAIAKTAAEAMGGSITASNGASGAIFAIRIPLLKEPPKAT